MSTSGIQLSGLATGMDTASIVSQLMTIEKRPVVLMQKSQAKEQARLDAYRALNTKLLALQTSAKNLTGVTKTLSPFSNSSATSSNTSAFTATAGTGASQGTYSINVTSLAKAQSLGGNAFNAGQGGGTLTISGTAGTANINISAGDTAQNIADAINADPNSGLNATVAGGKLLLTGKNSGASENYTVSMSSGPATLTDLGLQPSTNDVAGADASLTVNGVTVTSSSNTFTNALSGVNITATATGSGTVTVAKDNSAVINGVKDLVSKFNDIVSSVKNYTAYDPNTKKAGVLTGDSFVSQMQVQMTRMVTDTFDTSAYSSSTTTPGLRNYTDVGLTVQRDGTMSLNESKLTSALSNYSLQTTTSASAYQVFANEDGALSGTTKLNNAGSTGAWGDGIANRLAAFADQMMSSVSLYNSPDGSGGRYNGAMAEHIQASTKMVKDYDDKIAAYNRRLEMRQKYLQTQFTNMESTVQKLRSQGSYFSSQTNSNNGG